MSDKNIDVTRLLCHHRHLQTEETPSLLSKLQTRSAVKGGKIVGAVALVSFGLVGFFVPSVSAVTNSPPIFIAIERSLALPRMGQSLLSSPVLLSQTARGGTLKVSNGTNRDAYVKLIDPLSQTLAAEFFVKSNSAYTLEGIPDGTYKVIFALGRGWNARTRSFARSKSFAKFDKSLKYTTLQLSDRIQYRAFEITLNPVRGGNARTSRVNEREFSRY